MAQGDPHIGYIYPAGAGGGLGAEVEVVVGGQYLDGVSGVMISGMGVKATVIGYDKPMTAEQLVALMQRRLELRMRQEAEAREAAVQPRDAAGMLERINRELGLERPAMDANAPMRPGGGGAARPGGSLPRRATVNPGKSSSGPTLSAINSARKRNADAKRQLNPQLAETVSLLIAVAPDAEPGVRELRLKTASGLSNPMLFHVSRCEECREREDNDEVPDAGLPEWMPVVINGQIMPGDVDRFRFRATKGTRLVAAVAARSLIPYLADAVPGWFQATLTLYDARGNQLAYTDDFRFNPDPVIYHDVRETGDYVLEIKDAIYRGREDFVYRIALGEVPFVTGVFPLGGPAGAKSTVEVRGWNLGAGSMLIDAGGRGAGVFTIGFCGRRQLSNPVPFQLDTLPETLEKEPNGERRDAQKVTVPVIINGRIDAPGDWDVFSFQGRADQEVVAEVRARRLGSPLDSLLKLTDPEGKLLDANDDHEDMGAALTTHHADSLLGVKLPGNGAYLLHVGDAQHKGGPEYAYRLRISPRQPDFELRLAPSGLNARPGRAAAFTVYALRKDGFAGDITLKLKGKANGCTLSGAWVPAGQDRSRLTMTVPNTPTKEPLRLQLEGRATIGGVEVARHAMPCEDMMQAFAYRHLVPADEWLVSVVGDHGYRASPWRLLGDGPTKITAGGTGKAAVSMPSASAAADVKIDLIEPPEGLTVKEVLPHREGIEIVLAADAGKIKPGLKGNLIGLAFRENSAAGAAAARRRVPLGLLPAMAYEVVAPPPPAAPAKP
jgi:hypothetical protein